MVGDPEIENILSAPSTFAIDSAEMDVDFGKETRMSMSPYDVFSGASIGVAMLV